MSRMDARAKTLEIESNLRKEDEEMGTKYRESAFHIINMLKDCNKEGEADEFLAKICSQK